MGLKNPNCPKCGRRMMRMDTRRAFGEIWFCAGCGWKGSKARIAEEKPKEEVKEE